MRNLLLPTTKQTRSSMPSLPKPLTKPRPSATPWRTTLMRSPLGRIYSSSIAPNAIATPATAQRRLLASVPRRCKAPHLELFFGFLQMAWFAAACPSGQNCPNRSVGSSLALLGRSELYPRHQKASRIRRAFPEGSHRLWIHSTNLGASQPGAGACVARRQTVDPRREFPE